MSDTSEINISRRPELMPGTNEPSSGAAAKLRAAWHAIAPSFVRELRLLNARCRTLIPRRIDRYSVVFRAACRRLSGQRGAMAIRTPLMARPIFVRPFSSDLAVAVEVLEYGDYDLVRSLLPAPKTILDLGANIGLSVRLWQAWFPESEIIALEPNATTAAVARMNISQSNRPEAVQLIEAAASAQSGVVHLCTDDQPWADHVVDHPTPFTTVVRAMTVSECLSLTPNSTIDILKCDIEGAEAALFAECRSWISAVKVLVVETHEPYSLTELQSDLSRNGSTLMLRGKIEQGTFCVAFFSQNEKDLDQ